MAKIKNILAYTNPFTYLFGIPVFVGMVFGVFGRRIGEDVKEAANMVKDELK